MEEENKINVTESEVSKEEIGAQKEKDFSFIKRMTVDQIKNAETGFKIPRQSIFEDTRKRDAFGKHYHNNDGTMTAIYGTKPVHYYDEETKKFEDAKTNASSSTIDPQTVLSGDEPILSLKYY